MRKILEVIGFFYIFIALVVPWSYKCDKMSQNYTHTTINLLNLILFITVLIFSVKTFTSVVALSNAIYYHTVLGHKSGHSVAQLIFYSWFHGA